MPASRKRSRILAALVLMLVGVFFLAKNLGWITINASVFARTWWPAILIIVGGCLLWKTGKPRD